MCSSFSSRWRYFTIPHPFFWSGSSCWIINPNSDSLNMLTRLLLWWLLCEVRHHIIICYLVIFARYYQINMICDVWRLFLWRCSISDVAIELWFPGSKHAREKKNIYIYLLTALFKPTAYWLISLCQRNVFLYATLHHLTFVFNWLLTENNSWKI